MNDINELRKLAGLEVAEGEGEVTKVAVGHVDDERDMIKKELYQMGTYCVELYKMLDGLPDADFPHWWQGKVIKAAEYISAAKHYLENELNVPDSEPMPEPQDDIDPSGVSD